MGKTRDLSKKIRDTKKTFHAKMGSTILMQESRSAGLSGAIAGGADTFLGKNKGKTIESKLVKITKVLAGVFFVLSLASTLIVLFINK